MIDPTSKKPRPKNIVCILGMHRSGTSCLTGSLQASGLVLGKYHAENPYNKKGNRENQDIVDLHDLILHDNGGSWDSAPANVQWQKNHIHNAQAILAQYSEQEYWGFKDPRALLCLEGWKQLAPSIRFVGIYRHPNSVAASLGQRSGMSRDDALHLWHLYNSLLIAEHTRKPFPVLSFDWDEDQFHHELDKITEVLGLPIADHKEQFFSTTLRTHANDGYDGLPDHISTLYKALQAIQ